MDHGLQSDTRTNNFLKSRLNGNELIWAQERPRGDERQPYFFSDATESSQHPGTPAIFPAAATTATVRPLTPKRPRRRRLF